MLPLDDGAKCGRGRGELDQIDAEWDSCVPRRLHAAPANKTKNAVSIFAYGACSVTSSVFCGEGGIDCAFGAPSLTLGPSPCVKSSSAWTFSLRVEPYGFEWVIQRSSRNESLNQSSAEREGFEPSVRFLLRPLSKRVPSATRSPLLGP